VRQQGSLVAADRLRFDFSHFGPMSEEEIARVEDLVNSEVLRNEPVQVYETARAKAEATGAMAFFGDKYGEIVRVVEAGHHSRELCGGTHVSSLGTIGPLQVVSEASIGSNTRRIEAVTGQASLARFRLFERTVEQAAQSLRTQPSDLVSAVDRVLSSQRALEEQLRSVRSERLGNEADLLAAGAVGATDGLSAGRVVGRRDGLEPGELRDLAIAVRDHPGVDAVGLAGITGPERVALVVAARKGSGIDARSAASSAAAAVGGGGGGTPELATAGGRNVAGIEQALVSLRAAFSQSPGGRELRDEPDGRESA
jgi:alanyl-tRNA synthetase